MKILKINERSGVGFARAGFTLVELLVTIAILVVISSISLGVMAGINRNAEDTKDKRNAQTVAALYASARAAGATFISPPNDLPGRINELIAGRYGGGNLASSLFQLSPMAPQELAAVVQRLELDGQSDVLSVKTGM